MTQVRLLAASLSPPAPCFLVMERCDASLESLLLGTAPSPPASAAGTPTPGTAGAPGLRRALMPLPKVRYPCGAHRVLCGGAVWAEAFGEVWWWCGGAVCRNCWEAVHRIVLSWPLPLKEGWRTC